MHAFLTAFISVGTVFLLWLFIGLAGRNRDPSGEHWSSSLPVLGGALPGKHAWTQFHMRYYPMSLLFIAFEMEMMFMYPWAVVYVQEGVKALVEMGMFLAILSLGILYAWREGGLKWQ